MKNIFRFLNHQSFFPLVLSSALAMTVFIGRIYLSGNRIAHSNLVWNLALAWIPYLCSVFADGSFRLFPRRWWLLVIPAGLWLAFFPNAPYIVTDFLHLQKLPQIPLWYDILLLTTFAWTGIFLAIVSLRTMQALITAYLGRFIGWVFVGFAMVISGFGIYLGRFERWNSWDLITNPKAIVKDLAGAFLNPSDNLTFFGFTALFTAFLLVCYLSFVSVRKIESR